MRRLLLAAGFAVALHALVLTLAPGWLNEDISPRPRPGPMTLTLAYREPKRPESKSAPVRPKRRMKDPVKAQPKQRKPPPPKPRPMPRPKTLSESKTPAQIKVPPATLPRISKNEPEEKEKQEPAESASTEFVPEVRKASPIYQKNPPPAYPRLARKRGYAGTVLLDVLVNHQGRVGDLRVFTSSGYGILDRAAVAAVKEWLFEPGMRGGETVETWVRIPVRFEIKE